MKAMNKTMAVLALSVICTPVLAAQVWTWTGLGQTANWTDSENWSCPDGDCPFPVTFPNHVEADVIIPDVTNDPIVNDPTGNNDNFYEVKTLTLNDFALLTIPSGTCSNNKPCMGLIVYGHDGLKLSADSKISIEGGFLQLRGAGKVDIHADALIEFATTADGRLAFSRPRTSDPYVAPLYEILGGSTNDVIRGSVHGIIEGVDEVVGNNIGGGGPATLVLWDREITGSLTIYARLINNGRVVADASTHLITLACQPKSGSGLWKIDHSSARILVEVPVAGTTQSKIEILDGTLDLQDMWVTSGTLVMGLKGIVKAGPGDALIVGENVSCSN